MVSSVSLKGHPKPEVKGQIRRSRTEEVSNYIDGKKTSFNNVEIEVQRVECV
jgi:hypothetical protein